MYFALYLLLFAFRGRHQLLSRRLSKIRLGTRFATRMYGLLLSTCRYLMRGRRLIAPDPTSESRGKRGEYTHDYHTRCDLTLGCSRCPADLGIQLRVGILPERRSRPRCSDPRDSAASWAYITDSMRERERTEVWLKLLLVRAFVSRLGTFS
jgi:hypothetical protein